MKTDALYCDAGYIGRGRKGKNFICVVTDSKGNVKDFTFSNHGDIYLAELKSIWLAVKYARKNKIKPKIYNDNKNLVVLLKYNKDEYNIGDYRNRKIAKYILKYDVRNIDWIPRSKNVAGDIISKKQKYLGFQPIKDKYKYGRESDIYMNVGVKY